MSKKRNWFWVFGALLLCLVLSVCALFAPTAMMTLFWRFGSEPAVAVLQGEHWGQIIQLMLLGTLPFVPLIFFFLERFGLYRANRWRENAQPPEFSSEEERRAFYLQELHITRQSVSRTPWSAYSVLCGLGVLLFAGMAIQVKLPQKIEETGRDLELYQTDEPAVYVGTLRHVERPTRNGAKQIPDNRFVYYDSEDGSLRCAVTLIPQTELMQLTYTVTYLPETGTILSIVDADGNLRTGGAEIDIQIPQGCWLYGDLAVPVCDTVPGYGALSPEQQALFDLMYSQVLSGGVAAGKVSTRIFDLPFPLKKSEFNAVLELYEASMMPGQYPDLGYRTDDGQIVERVYCYGITHYSPLI